MTFMKETCSKTSKKSKNIKNSSIRTNYINRTNILLMCLLFVAARSLNVNETSQSQMQCICSNFKLVHEMKTRNLVRNPPTMNKKQWNKLMHYINGNKFKRMKPKTHIKILQLNKGNSSISTYKTR